MTTKRSTVTIFAIFLGIIVLLCGAHTSADQPPAQLALEILEPAADETLQGVVAVRVTATPEDATPPSIYVGFGHASWFALQRVGQTSEWTTSIDTTMLPNGEATLTAYAHTPSGRSTGASVQVVILNGLQCYFGDLHSHTMYSDGVLFPQDAYAYARDVARLDFFCLTDHLELVDPVEWADTREQALKANDCGRFVAFYGLEWTKREGHACLYDPPSTRWPSDVTGLYQTASDASVLCKFNHPNYPSSEVFNEFEYSEAADAVFQMVEVRGDAGEAAFTRMLDLGWHIAPEGSDDTHSANWGDCGTWTAVLAPGLCRLNILDALRNRHCYSTGDRNCRLYFWINAAVMGDIVNEPVEHIAVTVYVADPDPGDATARIELFEDGNIIRTDEPNAPTRRWETSVAATPGKHYYFVKITQADGNRLWSAPIWVSAKSQ